MECTSCNAQHELRGGRCLDCLVAGLEGAKAEQALLKEDRDRWRAAARQACAHNERLGKERDAAQAGLERVNAAAAEMRAILAPGLAAMQAGIEVPGVSPQQAKEVQSRVEHALSEEAGKGYVCQADVAPLIEALQGVHEWARPWGLGSTTGDAMLAKVRAALEHAKSKGFT